MDEMQLAVEKGYRILEIYEVYEYQVTQYSPETSEDGLFVDYIKTFLELKAEASGYPAGFEALKTKSGMSSRFGRMKG